ncbi:DUF1440 domain-containing protein [Sphingomonas solaris]|uniref:DUF1440 domain-containing protein n=1 Tax=Alterirhizorhabdus solaris TaxID=2529389 RepID=A0A558QTS9_9SPHN|nr:DUF1440 domain-containing protein [Sphingomonas solaris]TVV70539.1 DUF1440 domain-containing protein [Sphingomonas solaris]
MSDTPSDDSNSARILRGVLTGIVAGVAASFVMDRFQAAVAALSSDDEGGDGEPATEQAADAIALRVVGRPVPEADKPLGGQSIHYVLGSGLGIVYAVAAEFRPAVTAGHGAAFGIVTATLLDEAAVPAAGLGPAPWKSDVPTNLYGYASHLIFGGTAEFVRRSVRTTLEV